MLIVAEFGCVCSLCSEQSSHVAPPLVHGCHQACIRRVIKFEVGTGQRPGTSHERREDLEVQPGGFRPGERDQVPEGELLEQLCQIDEVPRLGAIEDRQDLVGPELAHIQRGTEAGLSGIQRAIVNREVQLALVLVVSTRNRTKVGLSRSRSTASSCAAAVRSTAAASRWTFAASVGPPK